MLWLTKGNKVYCKVTHMKRRMEDGDFKTC